MRRLSVVFACSAMAWVPGCSSDGAAPGGAESFEDVGGIQVALSNVPSSVRCVRIAATGSRSQTRLFSAESGSSASYSLTALPSGIVKVDGAAFSETCAEVTSSTAPRYVSEAPVSVRVDPYEVGTVTLRMLVNGAISIGIDFERDLWASEAKNPLDLAFVTDLPNAPAQVSLLPGLFSSIASNPAVTSLVHVGNAKGNASPCSDAYYQSVASAFAASPLPLVFTPGTQDWLGCQLSGNGGFDPLARLAAVRTQFFPQPGLALGTEEKHLLTQAGFPGQTTFLEHQLWFEAGVAFATLHLVGNDNDSLPWYADDPSKVDMPAARDAERSARTVATLDWLERAFAVARAQDAAGVVLTAQADAWDPQAVANNVSLAAYDTIVQRIASLSLGFGKPVLLIHGNSRGFWVDNPLANGDSLHGVNTPVPNFTRIGLNGGSAGEWLRLHVDPAASVPFAWQRVVSGGSPTQVKFNEAESNGGTPGDWAELYNTGESAVDLSGFTFKDNDDTHSYVLPAGTILSGGSYLVLEEAAFGFGLGAAESVRLFDTSGNLVDSHSWTAHATTTYGRCPNGIGAFVTTTSSSKGAANDCTPTVRINEIESNGGTPGDWIELYNAGTINAELGGWTFRDNDDTHNHVIPAGTTLAPGAYLLLEEAAFGFGLGAADSARLYNAAGVVVDTYGWTAHASTSYGRCANGVGSFGTNASVTKGAANDCSAPLPAIKINEVESNGGTPGDWVELYNAGTTAVDISDWIFKDNDDSRTSAVPAGTTIAPDGYYVLEEAGFGFGLGAADSARIYTATGLLVDAYSWTAHASTTYARCPSGSGALADGAASSKGVTNSCGSTPSSALVWPGANDVRVADVANTFGGNMSGLSYQPARGTNPAALWAVKNGPGTLYRLVASGATWTPATTNGFSAGKPLKYPSGTGNPDAEGVAQPDFDSTFLYVATERDNDVSATSRLSVLRFDTAATTATLTASNEWNLTSDLPSVGSNLGLEAITFVPDAYLTSKGFLDETTSMPYDPSRYPDHAGGVFLLGVEANGLIYAYVLNHSSGGFTRIASVVSGQTGVMDLQFDRDVGYLWSACDDTCQGQINILDIDTTAGSPTLGRFKVHKSLARPSTMPNINNEGIAFFTEAECSSGRRSFFWTDDAQTAGNALRQDSIPCGRF